VRLRKQVLFPLDRGIPPIPGPRQERSRSRRQSRELSIWEIDLTPPSTTIENPPDDPNPGPAVTFYFSASEEATFECSLAATGKPDDYRSCHTQKTYP
jgi:hypothetical protein